jgi:hypothetical protein
VTQLNSYGKAIRRYVGSGSLELNGNVPIECRFELVQTSDGRLVALCQRDDRCLYLSPEGEKGRLVGQLQDGRELEFDNVIIMRSNAHTTYDESGETSSSHVVITGNEVTVKANNQSMNSVTVVFALTNLTLLGTDSYIVGNPDGSGEAKRQQSLALGQREAVIRPLSDYSEIVRELKASRGTDVTSELLTTAASAHQLDEAIGLADDLCLLLTLARGCRVEWLCYDVVGSADEVLGSYHRSAITKRWGSLQLIATTPPEDTKHFLESAYPKLREVEEPWEFRNAVSVYTDGKTEGDFLESRALKLAVAMEHLVGRYLSQVDKAHILPPEVFKAALPQVRSAVGQLLQESLATAEAGQIEMMANHVQAFNWYPFRRALAEICTEVGLRAGSKERGRFKDIRDELVHRASFHPRYGTPWEQYRLMMTFIGKVLLAILGYDGYYYDWTKPPGWIGEDTEMRVKLELNHSKENQE